MMEELVTGSLLTLTAYTGLPTLCMRLGLAGAVRNGKENRRQVVLTFDDGPDPRSTPQVLNVLAQQGARACFFMLGRQAEAHPDLVRQVVAAGHEVGIHGWGHKVQALMGPRATLREVEATARVLEEITGQRPRFFRPPWGVFNLFTAILAVRRGFVPVVWSMHPWDWFGGGGAGKLYRRVMRLIRPGGVLLLHDAAGPGASRHAAQRLIRALPRVCRGLRDQGYEIVTLGQLTSKAS